MPTTFTQSHLDHLESRRESIRAAAEAVCLEARNAGRERLNDGESRRIAAMKRDLADMDETITEYREDLLGMPAMWCPFDAETLLARPAGAKVTAARSVAVVVARVICNSAGSASVAGRGSRRARRSV